MTVNASQQSLAAGLSNPTRSWCVVVCFTLSPFLVFVVFNLGLKVFAALLERSPRRLKSTELLAFFTALSYQTPVKLSRERKKKLLFHSAQGPQLFFFLHLKYSIYVLILLDKNPMMEFFTLLTKLIKFFFSRNWKNLIRFIIKATLWSNQLNLKHASSNRACFPLTVKVLFNECRALCCSFPSKSCKVSAVFVFFFRCFFFIFYFIFFAFVLNLLVNAWPCVCVCVCWYWERIGEGEGAWGGHAQTNSSPFAEWLISPICKLKFAVSAGRWSTWLGAWTQEGHSRHGAEKQL